MQRVPQSHSFREIKRVGGVLYMEQREQSHILKGEGEEILISHPGPTEKIIQSKQAH